jgi:glutamate N-acetyltransferase/amino-acid N-acetyltransferase
MIVREIPGAVCAPKGFKVSATYAGIRKSPKDDLVLLLSDTPASVGAVFTTNLVHAWCVGHNRERIRSGQVQAIICNAGNANACNGERGRADDNTLALRLRDALRQKTPEFNGEILTASTGVIGKHLPIERVKEALPGLVSCLGSDSSHTDRAANAIMTTDLVPKFCSVEVTIGSESFRIGGMAKGSGMIAPNMATMLGFITTDLAVDPVLLQQIVTRVVNRTFNRITVDGDTSTNDMVIVLANGASGVSISGKEDEFEEALGQVCQNLACKIARDGEGATKLVTIRLINPPPQGERIARTIAESPLVKTACFGNDPNWGRIMAAAGRSGVSFDPASVVVRLAGHEVFRNGEPTAFEPAVVSAAMKVDELVIELEFLTDLKTPTITFWSCDFSYDYVKINADYTT